MLRVNDQALDSAAETLQGTIDFHEWMGSGRAILFSHPKDFAPVCTTELGYMAGDEAKQKYPGGWKALRLYLRIVAQPMQ
ncbi:MAG TPA: hypothetical protein VHX86_12195 [Tepidisphaeraceae bacterium]|jgi:alkyl hydroperoxide reductase subunit AhpC|nr:hypothetical protein [Tepidisphaeraceae bacterium]